MGILGWIRETATRADGARVFRFRINPGKNPPINGANECARRMAQRERLNEHQALSMGWVK